MVTPVLPGLGGPLVCSSPHWCPFVPSRVMTYREHTAWVVKAYLQKHPEGNIMSVRYTGLHSWAVFPYSLVFPLNSVPGIPAAERAKLLSLTFASVINSCSKLSAEELKRDVELSLEGRWCGLGAGITRCVRRRGGKQELGIEYLVVGGFTASVSVGSFGRKQEEEGEWCICRACSWAGFLCNSLNPFLLPGKYCGQSSRY